MTLVRIEGLVLHAAGEPVLDGVDLTVAPGEAVGILGTSGSGKTTTALAVLGLLRRGIAHVSGTVHVDGVSVLPGAPPAGREPARIGYLGQDPGASLNPYRTVRAQLHRAADPAALLARVGLAAELASRYPHQLSGGQQQRAALAVALARDPRLLVLDEPTTGLDLVAKAEVHRELAALRESGVALLWISHDPVLATHVDRVVTLERGRVVESAPPRPRVPLPRPPVRGEIVLEAVGIRASHGRSTVLHGVDLQVHAGERVAVLGASGTGKTTLARALAGLHPAAGTVRVAGRVLDPRLRRRGRADRAALQYVAQSPAEALHPRQSVRTALRRPLALLRGVRSATASAEVARLLGVVGLPAEFADRLPGELSGGQRQRVSLARALAAGPRVLVCDEVTSALDPDTRDGVLALLGGLCAAEGVGLVLVTHDLEVAATADRVVVLAAGRVVADGPAAEVLAEDDALLDLLEPMRSL